MDRVIVSNERDTDGVLNIYVIKPFDAEAGMFGIFIDSSPY